MLLLANGSNPSPKNFQIAEEGLLAQTGGKLAVWSGRAATSLYHAYRLAVLSRPDVQNAEIIMPAISCTTAASVARLMGIQPRFADIDLLTGLSTVETIEARLTKNTIAVVVIHLLGNTVEIAAIAQFCKAHNLLLIEDPTQALGAKYPDGRFVGSAGDLSVYSFNKPKILDVGNGVLIANTAKTAVALKETLVTESLPFANIGDDERSQLALTYRNLHHSLVSILRLKPEAVPAVAESFLAIRAIYEPIYLRPVNAEVDMNAAWEALEESLAHRLKLARIYAENLQDGAWHLLDGYETSGVSWRFSLLLDNPSKQVDFSEAIRRDGFHVSNLYWPVNQFFAPEDECPQADSFARRIVNFWLDSSVDEAYVKRCCASILRQAENL